MKTCSIRFGTLAPLPFEAPLLELLPPGAKVSVEKAAVTKYQAARSATAQALDKDAKDKPSEVSKIFNSKAPVYLQVDPSFSLELGCVAALVGQAGEDKLCELCLACFPSQRGAKSPAQTSAELGRVAASSLYQMPKKSSQALIGDVRELVDTIQVGRAPDSTLFSAPSSGWKSVCA